MWILGKGCRILHFFIALAAVIILSPWAWAQNITPLNNCTLQPDGSCQLLHHVPQEVVSGSAVKKVALASNQSLDLRVVLRSRDPAGLKAFIAGLSNPKSSNYHHPLTPAQFALEFGVDQTDYQMVTKYLKSQGFILEGQSKSGIYLKYSSSVAAIKNTFKVNITNYQRHDGTMIFSPDGNPNIATPIAGIVTGIVGLDNASRFYPKFHQRTVVTQVAVKGVVPHAATSASPKFSSPDGTLIPSDIRTIYNLNSVSATGSGQTLGLFELDGYNNSDIRNYETQFNLPNVPLSNVYTDGYTGTAGVNDVEVVLDIDMAIAIAPGLSQIIVYEASGNSTTQDTWDDQWQTIADADAANVISVSWGGYEEASVPFVTDAIFEQMAAQGQAVFAAAGDAGAYDNCDNGSLPSGTPPTCTIGGVAGGTPLLSVNDPASDPYVTGVGISLVTATTNETWSSETASLYGGGGISSYWPIPTYQQGLTIASGSMVSTTMRNVPDVVLTADPATSYYIYVTGYGWSDWWGSSAATPLWAGFMTRVNQGRAAANPSLPPLGFVNPLLYQLAQNGTQYANDFHDIQTGNNSYYSAKAGYDDASGLGSFNGAALYSDLIASGVPAVPAGLNITVSGTQVTLTWDPSPGNNAVSYNVKRSTVNGSSYSTIGSPTAASAGCAVSTDTCTFVDTTSAANATYYYVVSAVNLAGESANSVQLEALVSAANYTLVTNADNGWVSSEANGVQGNYATVENGVVYQGGGTYKAGTAVTLTAFAPAAGYQFNHWSGDITGSTNPVTITMNASKNVTANFTLIPTPVGTCGTANQTYAYGTTSFGSNTFCTSGTPSPSTVAFPSPGQTVNWTCSGSNGGARSSCSAKQNPKVIFVI